MQHDCRQVRKGGGRKPRHQLPVVGEITSNLNSAANFLNIPPWPPSLSSSQAESSSTHRSRCPQPPASRPPDPALTPAHRQEDKGSGTERSKGMVLGGRREGWWKMGPAHQDNIRPRKRIGGGREGQQKLSDLGRGATWTSVFSSPSRATKSPRLPSGGSSRRNKACKAHRGAWCYLIMKRIAVGQKEGLPSTARPWLVAGQLFWKKHCPPPGPHPPAPPCAPSLEPVAAVAAAADTEAAPVDVRPTGLECFPPRPGGFRPLGFCMVGPLGVWTGVRAGHVLSVIIIHLQADETAHITMSPLVRACRQ